MIRLRSMAGKRNAWYAVFVALAILVASASYFWNPGEARIETRTGSANPPSGQQASNSTAAVVRLGEHRLPQMRDVRRDIRALFASAAQGDAAAVLEVFHASEACHHASYFLATARMTMARCKEETRSEFQDACTKETNGLAEKVQRAEEQTSVCEGVSDAERVRMRYQAVMAAAKLGDVDAQVCAVEGDFDQRKMPLTDAETEQHQIDAMAYFDSGLARGDWRVVQVMTLGAQAAAHLHGLSYLLPQGDDLVVYRMLRLLRLGATGEYAARLDERLKEYTQARANGLNGYDSEKLRAADAWAQQQYEQNFANSPRLAEAPVVCGGGF